ARLKQAVLSASRMNEQGRSRGERRAGESVHSEVQNAIVVQRLFLHRVFRRSVTDKDGATAIADDVSDGLRLIGSRRQWPQGGELNAVDVACNGRTGGLWRRSGVCRRAHRQNRSGGDGLTPAFAKQREYRTGWRVRHNV